tara:strand:- start:267 stop:803 length:537 start_codon:yes stop_codon:yes gene_type:complete
MFDSGIDFNAHNLFYHGIITNKPDNIQNSVIEKIKEKYMKVYHKIELIKLQRKQIEKEYEKYTNNDILFYNNVKDINFLSKDRAYKNDIKYLSKEEQQFLKENKTTYIIKKNRLRPKTLKMENKIKELYHKENILYLNMEFLIREIESYKINENDIFNMIFENTTLSEFNKNRGIENE